MFGSKLRASLDHERDLRIKKIKECRVLKDENAELWDTVVKQRIALDALQSARMEDSAKMAREIQTVRAQLYAVEAERDRYREALRRAFPGREIA